MKKQRSKMGRKTAADGLSRGVDGGLTEYMDEYLNWLAVRNYSERTIKSQRESLILFITWSQSRELPRADQILGRSLKAFRVGCIATAKPTGTLSA